jgi:voltage-gated potassium channel
LRAFRFLLALRAIKAVAKGRRERTIFFTAILFPFVWFVGALAILDAESGSSTSTISSIDKALWWALTTMSTVGYGDLYPVTLEGRFVAGALMIAGIGLFSVSAGVLASWLSEGKPNEAAK